MEASAPLITNLDEHRGRNVVRISHTGSTTSVDLEVLHETRGLFRRSALRSSYPTAPSSMASSIRSEAASERG